MSPQLRRLRRPSQAGPPAKNDAPRNQQGPVTVLSFLLAAVILAVFWPVVHCDFINLDDENYFSGNPEVLSGLRRGNVVWALGTTLGGNWHPVTWLSFMLDATLFGPGPRGPHLVNLLLHVVNGVLVLVLLRRMTGSLWRSAAVAGLFALHPLRVESVAWVTERKDVLSAFFFLLTLWAYVRYVRKAESGKQKAEGSDQRSVVSGQWFFSHLPSSVFYLLSLALFVLGLMSKPMLVTLPFVLVLLDYWPLQRFQRSTLNSHPSSRWRLVWEKAPFFLLSGIFCVVTFKAQVRAEAVTDWVALPLGERLQNALVSYARYLGKTFWPVDLAIGYPLRFHWPWEAVALAGVLVAGLCLGALWYGRKRSYLVTGWFWWLGTLIPVIGLVQAGNQAMADRYTYLPAIGLLIGLVWGTAQLAAHWRLPGVVSGVGVVVLLAACGLRTTDQLRHWRNSETLFTHALACSSDSYVAHNCLGLALAAQGKWGEAISHYQHALNLHPDFAEARSNLADALHSLGKWDEAIEQYEQALKANPNIAKAHNNFGLLLGQRGQWDQAIQHYELALKSDPNLTGARKNSADALYALGNWDGAIQQYQQVLNSDPHLAEAHNNLGVVLGRKGQWTMAIQHYQQALKIDPGLAEAYNNLGVALSQHGQWAEAIAHYQKAVVTEPGALRFQNKLARLLATCPQAELRNGTQALALAREVHRLSEGNNPDYLDTLAAAYAEAGQFPAAVEAAERALALAAAQTNSALEEIRARLKLYRRGSPYHEPAPSQ